HPSSLSSYLLFIPLLSAFLFFHPLSPTLIYTLSLHDALPICPVSICRKFRWRCVLSLKTRQARIGRMFRSRCPAATETSVQFLRSEEHTSELQSRENLVCRLLLEKKKKNKQ